MMDDGAGHRAGAAGEGFIFYSPFVGADGDVAGGGDADDVGICSLGSEVFVLAQGGAIAGDVYVGQVVDENDGVGDAGIQRVDGQVASLDGEFFMKCERVRFAHAELHAVALKFGADDAGHGFEAHRRQGEIVETIDIPCEAPGAIAAHFGLAAIGIVIAHPEIGSLLRRFYGQQPIGADAAVTIAQAGDLLIGERHGLGAVVDQHEIIAGAVHFGEVEGHRDVE